MCTNGVNTGQLEMMIDQIDDHIKLERRTIWGIWPPTPGSPRWGKSCTM